MNATLQLLYYMTKSELKSRYRNTFAGFLWVAINPLLTYLVHAIIFSFVFKIQVTNYLAFLLGGLFPWIFISTSLSMYTNCFVANREILLSFRINPLLLLGSNILDNFINFIIPFSLTIIVLFCLLKIKFISFIVLILPVCLLLVATYSSTLLLATLQIFYRDTIYVVNFILSMIFLLTPIIYPLSLIPERFVFLQYFNPFFILIQPFHIAIWQFDANLFWIALGKMALLTIFLAILAAGSWIAKKKKKYRYI